MDFLVTSIAAALTVASSTATRSSMPAQTKSGNIGLSTGGVCSPGDVGCHGDTDEAILYAFEYSFDIFVLVVSRFQSDLAHAVVRRDLVGSDCNGCPRLGQGKETFFPCRRAFSVRRTAVVLA